MGTGLVLGRTLAEHFEDEFLWVVTLEQGAIVVSRRAFVDILGRTAQPDDKSELAEQGDVFGSGDDTATRGDDGVVGLLLNESLQALCFELAEVVYAVVCKNLRDFLALLLFDDFVRVEEWVAERVVKLATDG